MAGQQMYLVEIFIDKISVLLNEGEEPDKNLIIKIIFAPGVEFIVKENQLATSPSGEKDIVEDKDENGRRKWKKSIRVGKSYLFPSYPDVVIDQLMKYPLQMEVWNDDDKEDNHIFVGIGKLEYDSKFIVYLKDTVGTCTPHPSMSMKATMPIYAECCCVINGEITYILRLSALGDNIVTEFQQLLDDPDKFVFRTDKAPSLFQCSRIESDDKKYNAKGGLYEIALSENPEAISAANDKIEVCTELDSCAMHKGNAECKHEPEKPAPIIPVDKIRMGDVTGPCGNTSCPLAHKVKAYLRNMSTYKKATSSAVYGLKEKDPTGKICGRCSCKEDQHTENEVRGSTPICPGCGGTAQAGETCQDRLDKLHGTGVTPIGSRTHIVNYMVGISYENPELVHSLSPKSLIVGNLQTKHSRSDRSKHKSHRRINRGTNTIKELLAHRSTNTEKVHESESQNRDGNDEIDLQLKPSFKNTAALKDGMNRKPERVITVYNSEVPKGRAINNFCTNIPNDKDCSCNPPVPTAPCKTMDCECMTEAALRDTRKRHKLYCPSYKHKENCPVNRLQEEELVIPEDEDEDAEALPYGVPPVHLGPCPVMGRPCTVPDGFNRMYKVGALPNLPPSYSEAGKVCCSQEFERIKKAIRQYLILHKDNDFRCLNRWYVDTETRCCDKEQRLLALLGKSCCGSHKLALNEKFNEDKKPVSK